MDNISPRVTSKSPLPFPLPFKSHNLLKRLEYIIKLTTCSKFYDLINEPLTDPLILDNALSTICYSSLLISELLKRKPQLYKIFKNIYLKLLDLLIKYTSNKQLNNWLVKQKLRTTTTTTAAAKIPFDDATALKLRNLSNYLSDIRIFNRLWAIPSLISFGLTDLKTISKSTNKSKLMKLLETIGTISIVLFQPFENIGFLTEHKWTTKNHDDFKSSKLSEWYYIISCRFWAVFVVVEIIKLLKQLKLKGTGDSVLFKSLVANFANLPLTVHWSCYGGCLSDLSVGFFGTFSTLLDTTHAVKDIINNVKKLEL
ncbi:hypothetical protein CANARDRAFT_205074 [[Candida] arabinofermentans NRRL YB-2248]|uniref:Uncharacterized protein n=1 Tax=[Candida] arabinofermentans NRRL YB-2248 TaxID=983967 RepID=A0A1E4SSM4_9ASCO|nr:hypothetical protein CANARDRAFT_205074 [[Candida] arabinofermentans NRRL YB-2248]